MASVKAAPSTTSAQVRVAGRSPACWRVTIENPPVNVTGRKWSASSRRSSARSKKRLMARGFHTCGDVESGLGRRGIRID
jgi:hypothetical protein